MLAALAVRHRMIDNKRRISMLPRIEQHRATQRHHRVLAFKTQKNLMPRKRATRHEGMRIEHVRRPERHRQRRKISRRLPMRIHPHQINFGIITGHNLDQRIVLIGHTIRPEMAFHQRHRRTLANVECHARIHRHRRPANHRLQMKRRVELDPRFNRDHHPPGHKGRIQRNHRIIRQTAISSRLRLLMHLHTFRQAAEIRPRPIQHAVDKHNLERLKRGKRVRQHAYFRQSHRVFGMHCRPRHLAQQSPHIGIMVGLDPAMRQAQGNKPLESGTTQFQPCGITRR